MFFIELLRPGHVFNVMDSKSLVAFDCQVSKEMHLSAAIKIAVKRIEKSKEKPVSYSITESMLYSGPM